MRGEVEDTFSMRREAEDTFSISPLAPMKIKMEVLFIGARGEPGNKAKWRRERRGERKIRIWGR